MRKEESGERKGERERKCVRDREGERERERERERRWKIKNEGVKIEIAKHSKKKNCLIVFLLKLKDLRASNNC